MDFDFEKYKKNFKFCIWLYYAGTARATARYGSLANIIDSTDKNIRIPNYRALIKDYYRFSHQKHNTYDALEPARTADKVIRDAIESLKEQEHISLTKFGHELEKGLANAHKKMKQYTTKVANRKITRAPDTFKKIYLHGLIVSSGNWNRYSQLQHFLQIELKNWMRENYILLPFKINRSGEPSDIKHTWARPLRSRLFRDLNLFDVKEDYEEQVKLNPNTYAHYFEYKYDETLNREYQRALRS